VTAIAGALRRALPILFTARIVALATLPLLVAAIVWIAIGVLAWEPASALLLRAFGAGAEPATWQRVAAGIVVVLTMAALAAATALAAIAVLTMPVIVKTVASRHFPQLALRRGGTLAGSLRNALSALLAFAALWLATLPLLIIPPVYVAASLLLNAWLSQRMFRYDALAEHASASEIDAVLRENRKRLFGLGLTLAPLSLIPVVNILVLPIYAGIAFTELCLAELAALRARNASIPA
jgi:uncharacterized protein involved in cysteine biosynthesis